MNLFPFSMIDDFREAEINDVPALFTEYRIDRSTLPQGLYCYEIRASDNGRTDFRTVEPYVWVNFTGSVVTRQEIPMRCGSYADIAEYGLFDEMEYDEWLEQTEANNVSIQNPT